MAAGEAGAYLHRTEGVRGRVQPIITIEGLAKTYRGGFQAMAALSVVLVGFTIWSDRKGGRDGIGDLVNLEEGMAEAEAELEGEATMDAEDAQEAE